MDLQWDGHLQTLTDAQSRRREVMSSDTGRIRSWAVGMSRASAKRLANLGVSTAPHPITSICNPSSVPVPAESNEIHIHIYKYIYIYCHLWQFFRFQHWSRGQGVNLSSALFVTEVWSRLHVQSLWSAFMRPQKPTGWSFHPELVGWHGDMVGCHPTFLDGYVQCIFTASSLCFFCFFVCLKAQESFWPLSVAGELSSNFSCRTYTSQSCLVCPW